jgi:hypothetical protein
MFLRTLLAVASLTLVLGFAGGVTFLFDKHPVAFPLGFAGGYFLLSLVAILVKKDVFKKKVFHHEPETTGHED